MSFLVTALSRLPLPFLYGVGYVLYVVVYRIMRIRRNVVTTNLRNSFPQLDADNINRLTRCCYRNYSDVMMEMVKSISIDREDLMERVSFTNLQLIEQELDRGQPILLTVAHQANIEWLLLALSCKLNYPAEAIYRPMSNATVEKIMTRAYTRFGGVLVDDRSVIKEIMQRKDQPRVVAIASDQAPNINDQQIWVEFLHQDTAFYLAPDTIARFVNYPVYFLTMRRESRGRYQAAFSRIAKPPYTGKEHIVVKAYIVEVEKQIRDCPQDWFWLHRRWKRKRSVYG